MILDFNAITTILKTNPNSDLVDKQRKYCDRLRLHFYGEKLEEHLTCITGIEKPELHKLRVMYASSNKDLFKRLYNPADNVFTARGGSIYFNLPDSQERTARQLVSDIGGGVSLKSWNQNNWKAHYADDPGGLIFMEIQPLEKVLQLRRENKSYVYPTYKGSATIFDYLVTGHQLEYVVFNIERSDFAFYGIPKDAAGPFYRVVDDVLDYIMQRTGDGYVIFTQKKNYFGQVPAMLCGNIPNTETNQGVISLFDFIIEKADEFLQTGSIKLTHSFLHGFPKYWQFAIACDHCDGTGMVDAEDCKHCKGTGKKAMTKVSDVMLLDIPEDSTMPNIAPDVAGYIEPSDVYHNISVSDLINLENLMHATLWGVESKLKQQGTSIDGGGNIDTTATETMIKSQQKIDVLHKISSYAEKIHKFEIDMMLKVQLNAGYPGASVNYGTRYLIESPDQLWKNYQTAKASNASDTALDAMLVDYYEAKYFNDPVEQAIKIKLMRVEPSVHQSVQQVKMLGYDDEYVKMKMYYGDWKRSLNQAQLISLNVNALKDNLRQFVLPIVLPTPMTSESMSEAVA